MIVRLRSSAGLEQRISNPWVAGSNPAGVANLLKADHMTVQDANGTELKDGDNVTLIKDLKVKGAGTTLKRGTMIKSIRLTEDEDEIDCRHEKIKGLVLRTEFVKKA
jgi:protein PhnA